MTGWSRASQLRIRWQRMLVMRWVTVEDVHAPQLHVGVVLHGGQLGGIAAAHTVHRLGGTAPAFIWKATSFMKPSSSSIMLWNRKMACSEARRGQPSRPAPAERP